MAGTAGDAPGGGPPGRGRFGAAIREWVLRRAGIDPAEDPGQAPLVQRAERLNRRLTRIRTGNVVEDALRGAPLRSRPLREDWP